MIITEAERRMINFAVWYSGMEREKVLNAYERWKREVEAKNKKP